MYAQNVAMDMAFSILQIVRFAMMASVALYAIVGEFAGPKTAHTPDPSIFYLLSVIVIALVGVMFVVRKSLVLPSELALAKQPSNVIALGRWRNGNIASYAVSESIALFGLVLRMMGFTLSQVMPFYVGSFVLLLFFGPRRPAGISE